MEQLVAKTYADALMQAALETGRRDEFQRELGFVCDTLSENLTFFELLRSPAIGTKEKKEVMEAVFQTEISPELMNFLRLLMDKDRGKNILEIHKKFNQMTDFQDGLVKGKVITAIEMTPVQLSMLESRLSTLANKTVSLKSVIDEEIVGGIIVEIGDKIIDGSIRKQLADLKEELRQVIV